ncbi:hypothetical protein MIMGU_mgv1a010304mg [Erythranthe guttata]|uniref:Uncharacterized protein n=4 Tax=Erythranthe guttata TaxID=4155 RepID=A0A022QHR4_ERYGU|nr:hypothetical protein MIMGU_mgv1a010304mg [Erythranthe guttata]
MSNGNQSIPSTLDTMPDGPKMKHCKPRRRGGMSGYLLGANSADSSYFMCTSGATSALQQNHTPLQDIEPLTTPLSRDSPLQDLQDNLQLEMIELDTITGSREASPCPQNPSMLEMPCGDPPPANQDLALPPEDNAPIQTESADTAGQMNGQEENGGTEISPPVPEQPAPQPEYVDPTMFNGTSVDQDRAEVAMDVKPATDSIYEPSETLTESGSASPRTKDSINPDPSSGDPVSDETMKVDESCDDVDEGVGGKRKGEEAMDKESSDQETVHEYVKSPATSLTDGESVANKTDLVSGKDDVQRKYKRLRRSVPKQR